jgi:hypothetical protein
MSDDHTDQGTAVAATAATAAAAMTTPSSKKAAMGPLENVEAERAALIATLIRDVIALRGAADADDRPLRLLFRSDETDPSSAGLVFLDYRINIELAGPICVPLPGPRGRSSSAR